LNPSKLDQSKKQSGLEAREGTHPMGEKREREMETKVLVKELEQALAGWGREEEESQIATPGGRIHVRWDEKGSATALVS
jgi:hypothetical protein